MFTVNGIDKLLYNLVPSKATGPDRIPACILKQYATELAPHLAHILNISLAQGDILTAGVKQNFNDTPLFKKGEKYLASNYKPVSLT